MALGPTLANVFVPIAQLIYHSHMYKHCVCTTNHTTRLVLFVTRSKLSDLNTIIIVTTHNHYNATLSLCHILCNNHVYTHSTLFTIFNFNFHSLSDTLHLILNLINGIMPNMTTLIYTWNTANILTGSQTFRRSHSIKNG